MLQMNLLGGFPPTEIGAFQQISEINQDLRQLQEELAANSENSLVYRATAATVLFIRDKTAYEFSPVDTGTLRAAHVAETKATGDGAEGIVFIHPDVVNPIYHKKPSVYGIQLIERGFPWHVWAMDAYQEEAMNYLASNILVDAIDILIL